jgi:hypothetical protein
MAGVPADPLITGVADDATQDNGAPGGRWARTNNNDQRDMRTTSNHEYRLVVTYPILDKPRQFTKPRDQWSRSECREVLAWLVGLIEPRTDRLLERLGLAWTSRPAGWLGRVESAVPAQVWTHEFWEASRGPETVVLRGHTFEQDLGPRLAASGEALGADLGLLLARSFAEELKDDARWVVGSHGRTYVSNNLPVLKGGARRSTTHC